MRHTRHNVASLQRLGLPECAGEPNTGANVFRRLQTQRCSFRLFPQLEAS